jgi:lipopolysaccharide export system permease protein
MVEVVMMLMLPLLAVALAIPPKRSTSALGVFVSIVVVVAYHKVNQYGQSVGELGRVDPLLALWGPFALLAAMIGWMYFRVAFVPGGQAIGALEAAFAKLAKRVTALLRRRDRARRIRERASEEAAVGAV